nr:putative ribonuclease H-like domain-containing protein [Tanacetum cinerariifolium]
MCDKKNSVLFTDTECPVLSSNFKLLDESQVLLRVPRENNMYNVNLKNIVPSRDLTCLFVKATLDESNLWHRRLAHFNFKTLNKLVKGNLVRGLPTKVFENDHTCVACKKGKQHIASCKTKPVSFVDQPLFRLHMDLFGPTFVTSLNKKSYCLVITYDYSRFTWVFFLASKDETSPILKTFITGIENQFSLTVKVIKSDNGTEFKNYDLNQFCGLKGIKREFSVPRTPQQNGVAERKNRTLIEAAKTMLADSLLPIPFWAEAINTACYVQNRVLVTKPLNKNPYQLLHGRSPSIGFMKPFGCPVTILNTLDHLGKFQGKANEGFLVGYSMCSKAFRVFNSRTCIIQETLHVNFLENKPNIAGSGPTGLFDIDSLLGTMNYHPVTAGNQTNSGAGFQDTLDTEKAGEEVALSYMLFPVWSSVGFTNPQNNAEDAAFDGKEHDFDVQKPESKVILSPSSTQGHTQEERIDYKEVFAPVARIEAIRLFLAYASFMGFMVYQMDVKSAFLYGTIEEEVYVCQPLGFEDPDHIDKVYKVVKALYGLHQAPRACLDKYVAEILRKFGLTEGKSASTPIDTGKPLLKDPDGAMDSESTTGLWNWLVQKQTALGEDISNPLLADNLPKIIWYSTHHITLMKSWLVQKQTALGQTATGKEISNPFTAVNAVMLLSLRCLGSIYTIHMNLNHLRIGTHIHLLSHHKPQQQFHSHSITYPQIMSSAFADTHNMVAILTKSDASEGFDQIIDFLNGSYIKYALIVNPHIYVSCIKQFWNTVTVKQSTDVTRLQALVDKKKVMISEAVIRDVLRLDDTEGVDCLPNEDIFTGLARMGYEKLSTKLTFYKAFFSSQWKFLIHTILVGKGFSGVETPLFEEDVTADVEEDIQAQIIPSPAPSTSPPPPQDIPSTSHRIESSDDTIIEDVIKQGRMIDELDRDKGIELMGDKKEKKKDIANDDQAEGRHAEIQAEKQAEIYQIDMDHVAKVLRVVTAASAPVSAASTIIPAVEPNIPTVTITAARVQVAAVSTRQRIGVVIKDLEEESTAITPAEAKDKGKGILVEEPKPMMKKQQVEMDEAYVRKLHEELNQDIDWDVAIEHVKQKAKEDLFIQRYQVMKKRPQTEAQARRNIIMYLKNTARFKLDYFKRKSYDDIHLIFEAKFNTNMEFLLKSNEQIEEEESRESVMISTPQLMLVRMRVRCGKQLKAKECQKPKRAKDVAYYREKMLLCKQEEAGIQLNAEQADWRDD